MSQAPDCGGSAGAEPLRFVIQHHRAGEGEHWDLMLEQGRVLLTWQLFAAPQAPGGGPVRARRIGHHRKKYLTYEGSLSRDRGTVRIVERGTYRLLARREGLVRLELFGRKLRGRFDLVRPHDGSDQWVLRAAAAE